MVMSLHSSYVAAQVFLEEVAKTSRDSRISSGFANIPQRRGKPVDGKFDDYCRMKIDRNDVGGLEKNLTLTLAIVECASRYFFVVIGVKYEKKKSEFM